MTIAQMARALQVCICTCIMQSPSVNRQHSQLSGNKVCSVTGESLQPLLSAISPEHELVARIVLQQM